MEECTSLILPRDSALPPEKNSSQLLNGAEIFTLRVTVISLVSHPGFFPHHSETSLLLFGKVDLENVK